MECAPWYAKGTDTKAGWFGGLCFCACPLRGVDMGTRLPWWTLLPGKAKLLLAPFAVVVVAV